MDTRPLGSTGLEVTPLGLGLAALGRPAYINAGRAADLGDDRSVEVMEARSHAVLDAAYAAGIRYLDAARSYGLAERFLGTWLRSRGIAPARSPWDPSGATGTSAPGAWMPTRTR